MKWLALTLLIGCGTPKHKQYIDPEFEYYVQLFESIHGRKVTSSVKFAKMEDKYAGFCHTYNDGSKVIEINPELWQYYTEDEREILFFHEAGHCELGLKHNTKYESGCPASIMYPAIFSPWEVLNCYQSRQQFYLENL